MKLFNQTERGYMLHEIIKADIISFRQRGHHDTGVYLHEPTRFYKSLMDIYSTLTDEQLKVIWLLRVHYFNKSVEKKKQTKNQTIR